MLEVKLSRSYIIAFAACLGLVFAGCGNDAGGGGQETVFLYVTNGYPGASKLTLYGPTGKLVSGLEFGVRTEEPIEVDRNVNSSDFTLIFDGAPTEMALSKPLFSMYPQETGTLLISRRSGEEAAEASLYRHIRTPAPGCVAIFGNSLALNNTLLPDEILSYSYQTEWEVSPEPMYDRDAEGFATTRCGYTVVPDRYQRDPVHDAIAADPWFFPVSADTGGYTLVWGLRGVDPRTGEQRSEGMGVNGRIWAAPTTEDFVECLSSAVSMDEDTTDPQATPECPAATGPAGPDGSPTIAESEVVWDPDAVATCFDPFSYTGFPVEPGQADGYQAFGMSPRRNIGPDGSDEYMCGSRVRVRTPVLDLIFQDVDDSVDGFVEGEGGFIEVDAFYPMSEQHFFVLYGRPVNAFVEQWNGEETSKPLDDYPYPGDILPTYENSAN
jgi:hypothetical protein